MADIIQDVDEEFELPSRFAASGEDFIDLKKLKKEKSKKVRDHPFKTSACLRGGRGGPHCRRLPMLGGQGF